MPDSDGIVRKIPILIEYAGQVYPSLSLAAFLEATGNNRGILTVNSNGLDSLRLGDTLFPVDAQGNMLIRYRGPDKTFSYLSAVDILTGRIPEGRLKGKIIFIGTTAAGLGELRPTPLDPAFPGVEIHATVLDNMLRKDFFPPSQLDSWSGISLGAFLWIRHNTAPVLDWGGLEFRYPGNYYFNFMANFRLGPPVRRDFFITFFPHSNPGRSFFFSDGLYILAGRK